MRNRIAALLLMLAPAMALAQAKPPELASSIHATAPVGAASFSKLMFHVYDASFWSDSGGWAKPPYALSLTYARDFSARSLADRTYDEMKHTSDLPDTTLHGYADRLATLWPDVKEGDRITALAAGNRTVFFANGKNIGTVADPAFAHAFFGIWLSPDSSEPELRHQLLNQ